MTPTTRPARSVLSEHGAREPVPINPGDEVWLTLPGRRADAVTGCELYAPSGARLHCHHQVRDAGCGQRDAVALVEPRAEGTWSYAWRLHGSTVEGTFLVGRAANRRRRR
ncbi:MAG: hypothetical protein JST53_00905 [Actinobacteria bacterium]|nr:hypothetical protein [Actinomycetota bacterium]